MSIDDRPIDESTHSAWFDRLVPDTMLIVEADDRPIGVVRLGDIDRAARSCSWSCHLGETDVAPGVGACLPVIGLGFGFEGWGADTMEAEVLGGNRNMLGIHRRLGIPRRGVRATDARRADGSTEQVVEFDVQRSDWTTIRATARSLLPGALRSELEHVLASTRSIPPNFDRG